MADPARILLVEDHEILAQSLRMALQREGHEVEKVEVGSAAAMVERAAEYRPDVVLLDLDLGPDVGKSVPLIPKLVELGARVVMLTGVTNRVELAECVEAGATGVANKGQSFDSLLDLVARAVAGETLLRPVERDAYLAELKEARAAEDARLAPLASLTKREAEVLQALLDGKPAETIAKEFFVSMPTVRSQIKAVLQKLGVNSQLQAVALARQAGWKGPAAG